MRGPTLYPTTIRVAGLSFRRAHGCSFSLLSQRLASELSSLEYFRPFGKCNTHRHPSRPPPRGRPWNDEKKWPPSLSLSSSPSPSSIACLSRPCVLPPFLSCGGCTTDTHTLEEEGTQRLSGGKQTAKKEKKGKKKRDLI